MGLLRKVGGALLVVAAALAGNWVGDKVRATTTGGPEHRIGLMHATPDGGTVVGLKVVLTNFVPALLVAFLAGRPRTLYAFLSGAVISALVGDSYEQVLSAWVYQAANQSGRILATPTGVNAIEDSVRI